MACETHSGSRSAPERMRSGPETSGGAPGRRSTASQTQPRVQSTSGGRATRDATSRPGTYRDTNICTALYAQAGAVQSAHFSYAHGQQVANETCSTGSGSSISGLAFYEGGSYPGPIQRGALLRRLLAALHLGDVRRAEWPARSKHTDDVHLRGRLAGPAEDRAGWRPLLRRPQRRLHPSGAVHVREPDSVCRHRRESDERSRAPRRGLRRDGQLRSRRRSDHVLVGSQR